MVNVEFVLEGKWLESVDVENIEKANDLIRNVVYHGNDDFTPYEIKKGTYIFPKRVIAIKVCEKGGI